MTRAEALARMVAAMDQTIARCFKSDVAAFCTEADRTDEEIEDFRRQLTAVFSQWRADQLPVFERILSERFGPTHELH